MWKDTDTDDATLDALVAERGVDEYDGTSSPRSELPDMLPDNDMDADVPTPPLDPTEFLAAEAVARAKLEADGSLPCYPTDVLLPDPAHPGREVPEEYLRQRRRQFGVAGEVRLEYDLTQQSQLDNLVGYQDFHFRHHEQLQRGLAREEDELEDHRHDPT
ncbi:hypothetical protein LTR22_028307 [Elasticomyces elasticus]|nr:hypothetical protein LTR22_028307 [Elasticomyces elasticus]